MFESHSTTDPADGKSRSKGEWMIRIPVSRASNETSPLSDRAFRMMVVLDGYARNKAVCIPSNRKLSKDTGKSIRTVQMILDELEQAGWIKRHPQTGQPHHRGGIALLRRLTTIEVGLEVDSPVANPSIWDDLPAGNAATPPCENLHTPPCRNLHHNKDEVLNKGSDPDNPENPATGNPLDCQSRRPEFGNGVKDGGRRRTRKPIDPRIAAVMVRAMPDGEERRGGA